MDSLFGRLASQRPSDVTMAGLIDPTQTGNYPVILSDRLLNKETNEIFTGVRCKSYCFPRVLL